MGGTIQNHLFLNPSDRRFRDIEKETKAIIDFTHVFGQVPFRRF